MKKRIFSGLLLCLLLTLCVFAMPGTAALAEAPEAPEDLPDVDIHSWEFRLCNSYNSVAWYTCEYGPIEGQGLDPRVVESAKSLLADARAEGYTIFMAQAFRNLEWIESNYLKVWKQNDYDPVATAREFFGIGINEHQTGLAIDFTDTRSNAANYELFEDPEIFDSELYAWLLEHCADYGFILRFPADKAEWYGVACPHAHFRYVGVEAAKYIMEHELCLEEFISLYDPDLVYVPEHGRFA